MIRCEVAVVHRERLPDAARHLGWVGSTAFAGCDDGSVVIVGADRASRRVLHRLSGPVTAFAVGHDRLAVGAIDGSAAVIGRAGTEVGFDLGSTVWGAGMIGDRCAFVVGTDVVIARGAAHEAIPLGLGSLTSVTQVTGSLAMVGGVRGVAWLDVGLAARDGWIELPTIVSLGADPRHRFVAAGDLGGSIHIVRSGSQEATELSGYPDRVELLGWLASGGALCATADDELTIWAATGDGLDQPEPTRLVGHDHPITSLSTSPTSDLVATGDAAGHICIWSPLDVDSPVARMRGDGVVLSLAWSGTGRELLISTSLGEVLRYVVTPPTA